MNTCGFSSTIAILMLSVTGCTAPDISAELTAAEALLTDIESELGPELRSQAAVERREAEARVLAAGEPVYNLEGECSFLEDLLQMRSMPNCTLLNRAELPTTASATTTLKTNAVLAVYLSALQSLANSESPQAVRTNAAALTAALRADGAARVPIFAALGRALDGRQDALPAVVGFWARQQQIAAIRRAIIDADPVIEELVDGAVAYYVSQNDTLTQAAAALDVAVLRVNNPEVASDPELAREANDDLYSAFATYTQAYTRSPAARYIAFRRLHAALRDLLTGPSSTEEILALLDELSIVLAAIEGDS